MWGNPSWKNSLKLICIFWHHMNNLPQNCLDSKGDNDKTNTSIMSASIKFIYSSKRFDGQSMEWKIKNIYLHCLDFIVCHIITTNQIMRLVLVSVLLLLWTALFVGTIANRYLVEKKLCIVDCSAEGTVTFYIIFH